MLTGLGAVHRGFWWIRNYDPRMGWIGVGPTLYLVPLGILFFVIGVVPMPRWKKKEKSKNDIYELH